MTSPEHIHPMLVHFPIVLLLLAVLIDLIALGKKDDLAASSVLLTTAWHGGERVYNPGVNVAPVHP